MPTLTLAPLPHFEALPLEDSPHTMTKRQWDETFALADNMGCRGDLTITVSVPIVRPAAEYSTF